MFADQRGPEGFGDLGGVDEALLDFEVDPTGYFGVGTSVRVDEYGRRWVLWDADVAEVVGAISTYDEELRRRFGSEPEGRYGDTSPEVAAPDDLLIQYQSLITHDCNSDSVIDYTTSSGSTWAKVTGILVTDTTRTEVLVMTDTATCSGVMLNDVTVLTAAHCAADVSDLRIPRDRCLR